MSGLDIPATVEASEITEWSDDVDVLVLGFGIAGGCAAVALQRPAPGCWCSRRPPPQVAPPRWPAATSIWAAAPRSRSRRVTRHRRGDVQVSGRGVARTRA